MKTTHSVSVLIPWANRPEVGHCLRNNSIYFSLHNAEVLLINAGGDMGLLRECIAESRICSPRVISVPLPTFNKSLALNLGAYFSSAHLLCVLDSDVILKSDFIGEAKSRVVRGAFATINNRFESVPGPRTVLGDALAESPGCIQSIRRMDSIVVRFADGSSTSLEMSATEVIAGCKAGHGHLLVRKTDFLAVGGYHSELQSWGWEDDDILFRLSKVLGLRHIEAGNALHLTHGDEKRSLNGHTRSSSDTANMMRCFRRYSTGDFMGSYSTDRDTWMRHCEEFSSGSLATDE
jgi:N-terminal domain of galactosyltransferase